MSTKKYWRSIEHLEEDPAFMEKAQNEFSEPLPVDEFLNKEELTSSTTSRRDFLKFLGFSVTAASLAACEAPVVKSIPYTNKPEEVHPGVANYYASTYCDGNDYASVVVKTREGRPIHIEGNMLDPLTKGGINARINSSVLSLYDSKRATGPMMGEAGKSWDELDSDIIAQLNAIGKKGGNIRILTNSCTSPSTKAAIDHFAAVWSGSSDMATAHPEMAGGDADSTAVAATHAKSGMNGVHGGSASVKHISYDAVSYGGMLGANKKMFGKAAMPHYHFDKANVIVSIGADFLVNWGASTTYTKAYGERKNPDHKAGMNKHFQFETLLTATGAAADVRRAIKPSEHGAVAAMLYNKVAGKSVSAGAVEDTEFNNVSALIDEAAAALKSNKGKSIVVAGSNDENVQILVNAINEALGNYGHTLDMDAPMMVKQGTEAEAKALIAEMAGGKVDAIIVAGCNPAYTMPADWGFADAYAKVGLRIACADRPSETTVASTHLAASHHWLESWGDASPRAGHYTLQQPTIRPLFNTRQMESSLLTWAGLDSDYNAFMKMNWEHLYAASGKAGSFRQFWNKSLKDGFATMAGSTMGMGHGDAHGAEAAIENVGGQLGDAVEDLLGMGDETAADDMGGSVDIAAAAKKATGATGGAWELVIYQKTSMGDGSQANNPWLQELPDPITRIVWDQYFTMHHKDMAEAGFNTDLQQEKGATLITVKIGDQTVELPVVAVPGQRRGTIGLALGYGRPKAGNAAAAAGGVNAFRFVDGTGANINYHNYNVAAPTGGGTYAMASTQTFHTMMGRKIVNETTLDIYKSVDKDDHTNGWNPKVTLADAYGEQKTPQELSLWDDHNVYNQGHRWGMSIDLNSCIGCGTCVTACGSENNVPIVGQDEVRRNREMFWMQIHRYYSSDEDVNPLGHGQLFDSEGNPKSKDYAAMEVPSDYPQVAFQPMMCQHCNHAPCETVCPVAATTHSHEGFNQMAYNRCVGTRYCANNCPFKVRRFNWFNYTAYDKFTKTNPSQDSLARMVLNPDVVVRTRGVMEKCSLCVQRVQAGKLQAKKDGTAVQDGSIQTACSASCPTNAITFGDVNDTKTMVAQAFEHPRAYYLLEEIGVQPNIMYQTKVRNAEDRNLPRAKHGGGHGAGHGDDHNGHDGHENHEAEAHTEEAHS